MKTLIIIDVQNDFMPGGSLAVPSGNEIIPVINDLQKKFSLVVATQDWHPVNHISFASNHPGKNPFDIIELNDQKQTLWPDHCVMNSHGADFHKELQTNRLEAIFRKGMDPGIDSYSGFYDNDHRKNTGLAGYLRERGVTELYFCGLAADVCVQYSVRDALEEGFDSLLVEDATRAINASEYGNIRSEFKKLGCDCIQSSDL